MKPKTRAVKRTPQFDEAYPWTASGPGWSNFGISIPVLVVELHDGTYRERREIVTIQQPAMEGFNVAVEAQRLVARFASEWWNGRAASKRGRGKRNG